MKKVLAFVFLSAVVSIAAEPIFCGFVKIDTTFLKCTTDCDVVDSGVVRCRYNMKGGPVERTDLSIYRFDDDGMWVRKYLQIPPKGHKSVYTSRLSKSTWWSCLVKDDFGRYSIAEGRCNSRRDHFISSIKNGESLKIHVENGYEPFAIMGPVKPVSWMECHPDSIAFNRINDLTEQPTDLKVYQNLPPGTYCEDFVATDALYWKP